RELCRAACAAEHPGRPRDAVRRGGGRVRPAGDGSHAGRLPCRRRGVAGVTPTGAASPDAPHALPGARAEWLRLILAFGSAAVAIVILTAVSWRARAVRQESAQWVMHTQEVQVAVER